MFRGQEAVAPVGIVENLAAGGVLGYGGEHAKCREVVIHRSESVGQPRTDGGAAGELESGEEKVDGGCMVDLLGVHALDEAEFVGDFGGVGHEGTDGGTGFAVLLVWLDVREDLAFVRSGGHGGKAFALHVGLRDGLAVELGELGFVVEKLEMARCSVLKKIDDALGLGGDLLHRGHEFIF